MPLTRQLAAEFSGTLCLLLGAIVAVKAPLLGGAIGAPVQRFVTPGKRVPGPCYGGALREFDCAGLHPLAIDQDLADGNGQTETPRTTTARIQENDPIPVLNFGNVRVAADDQAYFCGCGLDIEFRQVMDDISEHVA